MNSIADLLEPIQTTIEVLVARKNRPRSEQFAEGELARKLQKVFDEAAEQTLRRLAERQTVVSNDTVVRSILSPFDQAAGDLADETFEDAAQAMQRGRNKVIDTLRKQGMPLSFDEVSQTAISRVQESVFTASQRTMQRLVGDVKISLEQGIREGLGIADISKLLEEQFENMRGYELRRVARTETQHFQSIGAQEKMREIGVAHERWVTAGDDRVRESHVLVDGEITALDTPHSNGLRYPLDESGPIEEWVNCRCRAVPFLIPPDKAAPGPGPFYESDLINVVGE